MFSAKYKPFVDLNKIKKTLKYKLEKAAKLVRILDWAAESS